MGTYMLSSTESRMQSREQKAYLTSQKISSRLEVRCRLKAPLLTMLRTHDDQPTIYEILQPKASSK